MSLILLQYGLYRDGDNNLDVAQSPVIDQAFAVSARNARIAFTVEDTTARRDFVPMRGSRTESYDIQNGKLDGPVRIEPPHDPSARANLAAFVARTLADARRNAATQCWIELVDHGGGDGGGLESDRHGSLMTSSDIAAAIADGVAAHANAQPDDASRKIDGVVANQCLMATLGFADALSRSEVRWLAASPETMLAPGVPSDVAGDIAAHVTDPLATARAIVRTTMATSYDLDGDAYPPAAAFDVIDCSQQKVATMRAAVAALDLALANAADDPHLRAVIIDDARSIAGMVRFTKSNMPWRADRPALALYARFAADERLPASVRTAAQDARTSVAALVVAHAENAHFGPFNADYRDAAGPTVHFPISASQRDPWAPNVSETQTAFYRETGAHRLEEALFGERLTARAGRSKDKLAG